MQMSEWTVDTLREHIMGLLAEKDKQIAIALTSAEKAVTKAEAATEKRFDSVNEFRKTLSDQASSFVTRVEYDTLKERIDRSEGKSLGLSAGWGYLVGIVGIVIAVAAFFFK